MSLSTAPTWVFCSIYNLDVPLKVGYNSDILHVMIKSKYRVRVINVIVAHWNGFIVIIEKCEDNLLQVAINWLHFLQPENLVIFNMQGVCQ